MQISRMKNNLASVLAFGHMNGMGRARHSHSQVVAKPVYIEEPSMTAQDMGISFESDPVLFRAIHPVFSSRSRVEAEPELSYTEVNIAPNCPLYGASTEQQPGEFKPKPGWTWEV